MNDWLLADLPCEPERYELYDGSFFSHLLSRRSFLGVAGGGLICRRNSAPGCTSPRTAP
jgi:hypothetical protein